MRFNEQEALCSKYGVRPSVVRADAMLGIARDFDATNFPINGLRHPPQGDACGWYLWTGTELSQEPDFFVPMHASHLVHECPAAIKYLGLPAGWRFLFGPRQEDVWNDPSLLDVS